MNPCAYSEMCRMNKEELDLTNSSLLHANLRIIDLEEALAEYGSHKLGCWAYANKLASCSCGFREFETAIETDAKE